MRINKFKYFESKDKFPDLRKIDIDGYVVLIGKNAESNDHLTLNMANPEDTWFHVIGFPGSHIIVRSKDKSLTPEIKKEVAKLALKYSKSKEKSGKVISCKAKFVTKLGNMEPGEVKVDRNNAEEITVNN